MNFTESPFSPGNSCTLLTWTFPTKIQEILHTKMTDLALFWFKLNRNKHFKLIGPVVGLVVALWVLIGFFRSGPEPAAKQDVMSGDYELSNSDVNTMITQNILKKVERPEFTLVRPYLKNDEKEQNYQFNGDVLIRNDNYVRLTAEKRHQTSSFFSNKKINERSFMVELKFAIHGKGDVTKLHGDGLAILLTTQKLAEGEMFGVQDYYNGFAVFIDTYRNGKTGIFPYVVAAKNDGTQRYDKDNDGKANEIDGCIARSLWNPKRGYVSARLIYVDDGYLSLDFDYNNDGNWQNCVSLEGIHLPDELHFGMSSQTGDLYENVDVQEVRISALYNHRDEPITRFKEIMDILENDPTSPDKFEEVVEDMKLESGIKRKKLVTKPKDKKQTRRTVKRLQNAAKRLQRASEERRKERKKKFGRFFQKVKVVFLWSLFGLVVYLGTVVYRVKRKNVRRYDGII